MASGKEEFKREYLESIAQNSSKPFRETDNQERYWALARLIHDCCSSLRAETVNRRVKAESKQIYYFSMEFLIGRLLENYLINLGVRDMVEEGLRELGVELEELLECERDPGLGNGGLGRLAACFLDSMAAQDMPCVGMGIRYRYGLFRQRVISGRQTEEPDDWLAEGYPWETAKASEGVQVRFGGRVDRRMENGRTIYEHKDYESVLAVPYDVPIAGYGGKTVNTLRLWSARPVKNQLDLEAFNAGDYSRAQKHNNDIAAITCLLYPADHTPSGQRLRLKQEYFFVSAGVASVLRRFKNSGKPWSELPNQVAIHTNDTHPALCVPELMRVLMDEEGLSWETAWDLTCRTISYTNHTVMPEALEKWSVELLRELLPRVYLIIEEIDRRWRESFDLTKPGARERMIATTVLWDGKVRMANLSVIGGHAVNGVAALHTEILKSTVMKDFYALNPEKFNNKTNGVAHRRFLLQANPELSKFITGKIGDGWITDAAQLEKLMAFREDPETLRELMAVKRKAKLRLCEYIGKHFEIACNPDSVIDIQVKRIHAYKRQLLNAFKVLALYDRLKADPNANVPKSTFIFAGKAAQSYFFAKETIRFICAVADLVNADPVVSKRMKVVFMENFGVSMAQHIYPAADISEQISTAGKEASGTGCMKFMFNGAVTLGTLDGANVEILEQVGEENASIFGLTAEECMNYSANGGYSAAKVVEENPELRRVLDHLTDGSLGGATFWEIRDAMLVHNDEFFVLKDFAPYMAAWEKLAGEVGSETFAKKSLTNIARAGIFSSDRTVREYADEIWHLTY